MPEIRNEAHIRCKVISDALITPGVRAMIKEPVPVDWVYVNGEATLSYVSEKTKLEFPCKFTPRKVFCSGKVTEAYSQSGKNYTQTITMSIACEIDKKIAHFRYARYLRSKSTGSTQYTYSNTVSEVESEITFEKKDGIVELTFPKKISSLMSSMTMEFYAGYTNESHEAYDAGYDEGFEAGYQAGYEEGKMKNAVLGTAVLNQMVLV